MKHCLAVQSRSRAGVRVFASSSSQQPGAKVEQWLKTPFDIAAFGPRAALGAFVSLPERLQMLSSDAARVSELLQSPRPLDEKGALALREAEDALVDYLRAGARAETEALAALRGALPRELADALDAAVPPLPEGAGVGDASGTSGTSSGMGTAAAAATASVDVAFTADSVAENQIAAEAAEVRAAVAAVKTALEALRDGGDPSRAAMLRLNLKEARDGLARRLREAAPPAAAAGSGAAAGLNAALREARVLLDEIDGQFFAAR